MQLNTNHQKVKSPLFASLLASETRTILTTKEAAFHINRAPNTLRIWACLGNGPIKPIRINGRLAWMVSDISALINGAG